MADLYEQADSVNSREDFAQFVNALRSDLIAEPENWQNLTLEMYLDAISAWTQVMDRVYANLGKSMPVEPSWETFAQILLAGKIYE